jgi:hypothetical protein
MEATMAGTVPAALAEAKVLDETGAERVLGAQWAERPAVLVFLRHFG